MAFFGIESFQVQPVPEDTKGEAEECLLCESQPNTPFHSYFQHIRAGDVLFLKQFIPRTGMEILAVGVVSPGTMSEIQTRSCVHVQWAWRGVQHAVTAEDHDESRGNSIYEEFDLAIQREIIDLMPISSHDPFAMVMAAPTG